MAVTKFTEMIKSTIVLTLPLPLVCRNWNFLPICPANGVACRNRFSETLASTLIPGRYSRALSGVSYGGACGNRISETLAVTLIPGLDSRTVSEVHYCDPHHQHVTDSNRNDASYNIRVCCVQIPIVRLLSAT